MTKTDLNIQSCSRLQTSMRFMSLHRQLNCVSLSIGVCQLGCVRKPKQLQRVWTSASEKDMKADQWKKRCFSMPASGEASTDSEPQTGHDFSLKHTADVFSLCLEFRRPLKWLVLLSVKCKYTCQNKGENQKGTRYWPVMLPHRNRVSGKPGKKVFEVIIYALSKCNPCAVAAGVIKGIFCAGSKVNCLHTGAALAKREKSCMTVTKSLLTAEGGLTIPV